MSYNKLTKLTGRRISRFLFVLFTMAARLCVRAILGGALVTAQNDVLLQANLASQPSS